MGVSFAGTDLIHPDPDGNIQDWFNSWLPLSESRMILEWPTPQENLGGAPYYPGSSLPAPNWSKPPRPKINSWYRPTGASRWSFGFFLADYARLQTILSAIGGNNTPQTLTLDMFPTPGHARSWGGCYLLPPHPVSASVTDAAGLWILPIVDERWYWQFVTLKIVSMNGADPTTWNWAGLYELTAGYLGALGANLTFDAIPAQYLQPNMFFIGGTTHHNVGSLLDAVAYSVGQRIVPAYPGYGPNTIFAQGWKAVNWSSSQAIQTTNLSLSADVGGLQSGELSSFPQGSAIVAESVSVVFRAYRRGIILDAWQRAPYISLISAAAAGQQGGTTPGYLATVLSTALADISAGGNINAPDNQANLDALALKIARDYYAGLWIQDSAVIGISQWQESGYDDWVEFTPGRPDGGGSEPSTRVHSVPYNLDMQRMLHYDPSTWEYGERIAGTLDGDLSANGSQAITLTKTDGAAPIGVVHLTVTDILGGTANSGDKIEAIRFSDVWAVVGGIAVGGSYTNADVIGIGSTSVVILAGNSGTFTLSVPAPPPFPAPPLTVIAAVDGGICLGSPDGSGNTVNYLIGKLQDGTYAVLNPTRLFYGQFSALVDLPAGTHSIAGLTGTFTIFSGNLGAEITTGATVTAFLRDGAGIPGRSYPCIVTPNNTYEKLDDGALIPAYGSTEYFLSGGISVLGVSLNTRFGTINAELRAGILFSGNSNLYLLGNATADLLTTYSRLYVVNPSTSVSGTVAGNIAPGAGGVLTTAAGNGVAVVNFTDEIVHSGSSAVCIWNQGTKTWLIVAAPAP